MSGRQSEAIQNLSWIVLVMGCGLCLASCGGPEIPKGTVKKVPVSGKVTLKGAPLVDAEVYFYTERFTGFGKTDEEGKFQLAQGAAIGPNKVYISKIKGGSKAAANDPTLALDDPTQTQIAAQSEGGANSSSQETIPPEYSSQTNTKLKIDVPEGGEKNADFNL